MTDHAPFCSLAGVSVLAVVLAVVLVAVLIVVLIVVLAVVLVVLILVLIVHFFYLQNFRGPTAIIGCPNT